MHKAVRTFDAQYKLLTRMGKSIETKRGINNRALSYLGGFIQSAFRAQHLDVESRHAFAIFMLVYEQLWGEEAGKTYLAHWVDSLNDDETQAGTLIGTEDYWFCSRMNKQPIRWFGCFEDSEKISGKGDE